MSGALSHLRVLELADGVAASYCAKLFATYGAEVIKVESPSGGDPIRARGPFAGQPGPETSIPFLWLNTAKKSVVADLETTTGRAKVRQLALTADIVIENFSPGTLEGTGLSYGELAAARPGIVVVSITPFGQDGPYRDFLGNEIVSYATGGGMHLTGDPDREPLVGGFQVANCSAGMAAYIGALAAVFGRQKSGRGRHVDVSIQEAMLDNIEIALVEHLHLGHDPKRKGDRHALVPWELFPCRDGWAAIVGGPIRKWLGAVDIFEEPRLNDPKFRHVGGRIKNRSEFEELIRPWLERSDRAEILTSGRQHGLAFGILNRPEDALEHPQHRARGFFQRLDHPVVGEHRVAGEPFRIEDAPAIHERAPLLGEHTEEFLTQALGTTDLRAPEPSAATPAISAVEGVVVPGVLDGVRVLDFSVDWAGPHAARILADLGAEVIKVEYPSRLDGMRGAFLEDRRYDKHPRFWQLHRNKKSLTLDLKRTEHHQRALELVAWADVVVDSSRPGVLERLGLGWEVMVAQRPDVILVQMPAFGSTGPDAAFGGFGGGIEPQSGLQALTGYSPQSPPRRIREMDVTNGVAGACAIFTALVHRQATGLGQRVDVSQMEAAISTLAGMEFLETAMTGLAPQPTGNRHRIFAPQGCYPCREDDQWVVLTVRDNQEWQGLCHALGRPDLADDSAYSTAGDRMRSHDLLDEIISTWTRQRDHRTAMEDLQAAGVPAGAVLRPLDLATDPHLSARGWFLEAEDGGKRYPGHPFRFVGETPAVLRRGPSLGEHDREVIVDLLGRPESEVEPVREDELGTSFDPE
ncbi:MAG: CoA transferase [Acidobacteriota bacterium]|nr:CoA transferase [Acidobacteriota bacterium]